MSDYNYNY